MENQGKLRLDQELLLIDLVGEITARVREVNEMASRSKKPFQLTLGKIEIKLPDIAE